ncbi:hypothetical protein GGR56DRAFT_462054 [Xylariaceae sp. FL0804]|nr:hypothetical protein GGR56DRAFT_462054 [Xylariaceae sp. FL0804]
MAHAHINTVPLEVLLLITSHLPVADYGALRLACRHLEASLFAPFAQQYFGRMQFAFTDFSLQGLVDISQSRLSPFLKHLIISAELFMDTAGLPEINTRENPHGRSLRVTKPEITFNAIASMCEDQRVLLDNDYDKQMFLEAFRNLSLESVAIMWCDIKYPLFEDCHFGDRQGEVYKSFGYRQVERKTGIDLNRLSPGDDAAEATCVRRLLIMLAKSGLRPKKLECDGWTDDAFIIHRSTDQTVQLLVSEFKELALRRCISDPPTSQPALQRIIAPNDQPPYAIRTYSLRKFLACATGLENLELGAFFTPEEREEDFFTWLGSTTKPFRGNPALEPPASPVFGNLKELKIVECEISVDQMVAILRKFSTMRKLNLVRVVLTRHQQHKAAAWAALYSSLIQICDGMDGIYVSRGPVQLNNCSEHSCSCSSPDCPNYEFEETRDFYCAGPHMKQELQCEFERNRSAASRIAATSRGS